MRESAVLKPMRATRLPQAAPPRGPCDTFLAEGSGSEEFRDELDLVSMRARTQFGALQVRARAHWLERIEEEDTDQTYLADWIPRSTSPDTITRGWLTSRDVTTGSLQRRRLEGAVDLAPVADGSWRIGVGLRRSRTDGRHSTEDSLLVGGEAVSLDTLRRRVSRADVDAFAYGRRSWEPGPWLVDMELRGVHFGGPGEYLALPRLRASRRAGQWQLSAATGLAAQPPTYRELLSAEAMPASQKGLDLAVEVQRQTSRARWRGALYHRQGWDRVSYTLEDVRIRYSGVNDSRTRTWGLDTQVRGQVGQAVGSVTYSYLVSRENLVDDGAGWVPTALDQRHTATAYLEDRMDLRFRRIQASRFHIRALFGSGFPFTPLVPVMDDSGQLTGLVPGPRHSRRDDAYIRFDVGLTQEL